MPESQKVYPVTGKVFFFKFSHNAFLSHLPSKAEIHPLISSVVWTQKHAVDTAEMIVQFTKIILEMNSKLPDSN